MPRQSRIVNSGEPTVYHVISRSTLPGYCIGDVEKDYFVSLLKIYSKRYFADVLGFCVMGNHIHLAVRMYPGDRYSDGEIKERFEAIYGTDVVLSGSDIQYYRDKWASLSEFVKDLKQNFTRFYNKRHNKKGFFWGDRFKSMIVENGDTLINCLAYIDLNPVRAGMVKIPEEYRWNTLGYLIQTDNKDDLISLDFGLIGQDNYSKDQRISFYRKFVYGIGVKPSTKGRSIPEKEFSKAAKKNFEVTPADRFFKQTRYFTDSKIIGSKEFVSRMYDHFKDHFKHKREKIPNPISGLSGVYALRRFS
jgi:REP element-mobilizing transposase RayT